MKLSDAAKDKLELYQATLIKWNKVYNLLSNSQSNEIWQRHILDSIQLYDLIPHETEIITDFGSGAGFPAIPLAIILQEAKALTKIYLYESVTKKTSFLEEAARILQLANVEIVNDRIENNKLLKADIITARAFAELTDIFKLSKSFVSDNARYILLKGKNIHEEIEKALKNFSFNYDLRPSATGDGFIFLAENVKENRSDIEIY